MNRKLLFLLIGISLTSIVKGQVPVANFTTTPTSGCAPFLVTFQDLSTNGPTAWAWDFGTGAPPSTQQDPTVVFANPGTYSVTLTASNGAGSSPPVTKTAYITVYANPIANFSSNITTGCYPLKVQLTDNSTSAATIVSWNWDFGDGTTSPAQNPLHVYTSVTPPAGVPVTLQVTDKNGCTNTLTKPGYIQVPNGIDADFTSSANSAGCKVPIAVGFTNTTSGGAPNMTYNWSFGDGQQSTLTNPQNNYNATGSYTVQLIATSPGSGGGGCQDTVDHIIQLTASNVQSSFTAPDSVCIGTPVLFQNTSNPSPNSTVWNFGDNTGSTAYSYIKTYTAPGTYTVTLTNTFGPCQDVATKTIKIFPFPVTNFKADDSASCRSSLTVNFTDLSTNALSWQWNFGDGGTSTGQNPSHAYSSYGQYTVTLITSNSTGCNDTLVKTNYINMVMPSVTVSNLPFSGCIPLSFTPTAVAQTADPVTGYSWNFGNGDTSTQAKPTVSYTAEGVYNVTLTITTKDGCTASSSGTVTTGSHQPTAAFTVSANSVCAYQTVTFTDQSTGTPPPNQWLWDFGNGDTSHHENSAEAYEIPGTYLVVLKAYTNGCWDTASTRITVKPPLTNFFYTDDCSNNSQFQFRDSSLGALSWSWKFGDGGTSFLQQPVHTFPAGTGTYDVTLTATNGACSVSIEKTITVVSVKANFTMSSGTTCRNSPVNFNVTGSNPANIIAYAWNFGDTSAVIQGGTSMSHIYTKSGNYTVTLTVTDINGCPDSIKYPIQVNGPTAAFQANTTRGCKGLTVTMTDQSVTDGTHPIINWNWDYGDGTTVDYKAPPLPFVHTYNTQGIFTIRLIVTDASGCIDSITKVDLITVNIPKAQFSSVDSMSCPGSTVVFTNNSTGDGLQYNWLFGDGNTSVDPAPGHAYYAVGYYNVQLSIVDQYGCTDSLIKTDYIRVDTPNASFTLNDSISSCPPMKGVFTFKGHYAQLTNWVFGDGATSPLPSPVHNYNIPGNFTAILTVTSPGGCIAQDSAHITIFGPYGTLSYSPDSGCSPLAVNFNVVTKDVVKYYWNFGDNGSDVNTSPTDNHTYTTPGSYLPTVILVDSSGCKVPVNGPDSILVVGVQAKFVYDRNVLCDNGAIQFTDSTLTNGTITNWFWDFGDGATSTAQNPSHYYAGTGFYTVKLVVTTQYGCTDTYTLTNIVKVVNSPVTDFTGANSVCVPAILHFAGVVVKADTSVLTWAWNLYDGQILSGKTLPPLVYPVAGQDSVQLIVTNSSGCKDTVNKQFTIYPLPPINAGLDTAICLGQNIGLLATGALTYNWLPPNTTLSCTNCNNPVANPTLTTDYIVQGTNNFGCTANDTVQVKVILPTTLAVTPLDSLCKGQSIQLSASGADLYTWTPAIGLSDPSIGDPVANPDTTTLYSVTGSDYKSCFSDTKSVQVTVFNYPTVTLGPDTVTLPVGTSFQINGIGSPDIVSIIWAPVTGLSCPNCLAPVAKPVNTTTYFVKVTNNGGCSTEDKITFIITCNDQNFFVPNTFSPNGDGMNDYFYVRGKGLNTIHSLQIFNRWGQKVFEKRDFPPNDQNSGWDGTINGQKAPMDVYVYLLEIICDNSTIIPYHGNVALIR